MNINLILAETNRSLIYIKALFKNKIDIKKIFYFSKKRKNLYKFLKEKKLLRITKITNSNDINNSFLYKDDRYSHLIDPMSGYPIRHDIISATILAHNCADADAIATAVMVKGYDAGLSWIDSMPDVECLLIKKDGNGEYVQGRSAGFNY